MLHAHNQQLLLQISAAQGPVECCKAVTLTLAALEHEAKQAHVKIQILETTQGPAPNTLRSALLTLEGSKAVTLAQSWQGSIQWICPSRYRPSHKRKNWFIGVTTFMIEALPEFLLTDVTFETMRAGGPGGQHVNKTETAVRATHLPSGISVKVQTERSQYTNKNLALLLLKHKLEEQKNQQHEKQRHQHWQHHHQLQRGNPVRTFTGDHFTPV